MIHTTPSEIARYLADNFTGSTDRAIVLMVGIPGSGKTTIINQIIPEYYKMLSDSDQAVGLTAVSTDAIIEQHGVDNNLNYSEAFEVIDSKLVTTLFNDMLLSSTNSRENIIIDQTNVGVKSRNRKIRHIQNANSCYKPIIICVSPPSRFELERRLQARSTETGKHIPVSVIDQMTRDFTGQCPEDICQTWFEIIN
jgi:predicted kinase